MSFLKNVFKIVAVALWVTVPLFAQDSTTVEQSANSEVNSEIALRDSLMAVQDSSCSVEKQSLRQSLELEQAKSVNWEQSYNTMKKDNELCAKALSVSLGVQEKKKEKEEEEKEISAMATGSSFFGGLGLGLLIMWLIMK